MQEIKREEEEEESKKNSFSLFLKRNKSKSHQLFYNNNNNNNINTLGAEVSLATNMNCFHSFFLLFLYCFYLLNK
jgi:hypothetical protein